MILLNIGTTYSDMFISFLRQVYGVREGDNETIVTLLRGV